ncbi:MAG: hypothetical protein IPG42_04360 [Betaproteobacteria bacterium]|nr:hypothetical protein [Betaproteobacteria bacterium]
MPICPMRHHFNTGIFGNARPVFGTLALVVFFVFDLQSVLAAPNELVLQMDTGLRTDSNPFRFTDDATPQASLGTLKKSDSIFSVDVRAAGIAPLDSPETRLLLSGQLGKRDYQQFSQLDNQDGSYRTAFQWRFGDLWRGEVLRSSQTQLYQYLDGSFTQKAMLRTELTSAEVALKITPEVQLPATISRQTLRFENAVLNPNDRNDTVVDVGARWDSSLGSTLRTGFRSTQTHFLNRSDTQIALLDSGYRDRELYLSTDWQYSVMSRVGGRLGYVHRNYSVLGSRNFSVLNAELLATYDYSPLTRFTASIWNRPVGTTDVNTLYTINTGGQLGVRWAATPKTRLTLQAAEELQRYQSTVLGSSVSNPELRRTRLGGSVVHAFTPDIRVYAEGFREKLDRGSLGSAINQTSIRLGLEYTYESLRDGALRTGLGERRQ